MEKILIVDDEKMMLHVAMSVLKSRYEVVCASSAEEAIRLYDEEEPDLILTDMNMPGMDGLEMVEILRGEHGMKAPVMFMTGSEGDSAETRVFDHGAEDFIRKPFKADVLLYRVERIFQNYSRIKTLTEKSRIDGLTGFLNKISAERKLKEVCRLEEGMLAVLDLDDFKLINDLHGHEAGDRVLVEFSNIVRRNTRANDIIGRIGGDEFVVFFRDMTDENVITGIVKRINEQLLTAVSDYLTSGHVTIPLGVSAGAVLVPACGTEYAELFNHADKLVYQVKQNGKHYCLACMRLKDEKAAPVTGSDDIKQLNKVLGERTVSNHALWVGQSAFGYIYRYMLRYMQRYHGVACKVLFTIVFMEPGVEDYTGLTEHLGNILKNTLRSSDIMMQNSANQFFLMLPGVTDEDIDKVIDRTLAAWGESEYSDRAQIISEVEMIDSGE